MSGLLGGAISLVNGLIGSNAAKSAANAESAAIQKGINFQSNVYDTSQNNLNPWISGGQSALNQLLSAYGLGSNGTQGITQAYNTYMSTPYYQYPLQQGQLALNRQLASSGLTGSGAALKDASAYNQGYASQYYNNYLSGLSGLSSSGQSAATSLGSLGNQAASNIGNLYTNQGVAQASGIIGSANSTTQGLSGLSSGLSSGLGSLLGLGGTSYK